MDDHERLGKKSTHEERFEGVKGVKRSRKLKDRQDSDQKRTNNDLQTKTHYTEN